MRFPKLAVVRPFPECYATVGHLWHPPTVDGVQVCHECGIWRLIEVPGGMLPDEAIQISAVKNEIAAREDGVPHTTARQSAEVQADQL